MQVRGRFGVECGRITVAIALEQSRQAQVSTSQLRAYAYVPTMLYWAESMVLAAYTAIRIPASVFAARLRYGAASLRYARMTMAVWSYQPTLCEYY
eukprot:2486827-Rhodomonas_salina.1